MNVSTPPLTGVLYFYIQFFITCPCSAIQGYTDILNANADTIMAGMEYAPFASGYSYDFDVFPTFNIANGTYGRGSSIIGVDGSHIETTPYGGGETAAIALANADATRKKLMLLWTWNSSVAVGTPAVLSNNFPYRSFATGGAIPNIVASTIFSVTPPTLKGPTPTLGSVYKRPMPVEATYTFATRPGAEWLYFTVLGQINSIPGY